VADRLKSGQQTYQLSHEAGTEIPEVRSEAQTCLPAGPVRQRPSKFRHCREVVEHHAGRTEEKPASGREPDGAARTLEQSHAELGLQVAHPLAHRSRNDVQACGRTGEVQLLRNSDEVLKVPGFHVSSGVSAPYEGLAVHVLPASQA